MGFGARYFAHTVKGCFKQFTPLHLVTPALFGIMAYGSGFPPKPLRVLVGAVCGIVVMLLFLFILAVIVTVSNGKLYSVLDEQGFSREYLAAYEKARITGKPFRLQYAVEYAEIFMRMGQPADAIKYLNTVTMPASANVNPYTQISYFYIYVMSALKINNLGIAEDIWRRSMPLINNTQTKQIYKQYGYLLYLALIAVDLFAARSDKSRLERAYEQTTMFMKSKFYKKAAFDGSEYKIFLVYELNMLGKAAEANSLYYEVKQQLESSRPLFTALKNDSLNALERAKNGVLPFIY